MHCCWRASLNIIVTCLHIVMSCVYLLLPCDIMVLRSSHCVSIASSFAKYHEFLVNRTLKVQHSYFQFTWSLWDIGKCFSLWPSQYGSGSTKPGRWVQRLFSLDLKMVEPWSLLPGCVKARLPQWSFIHLWFV